MTTNHQLGNHAIFSPRDSQTLAVICVRYLLTLVAEEIMRSSALEAHSGVSLWRYYVILSCYGHIAYMNSIAIKSAVRLLNFSDTLWLSEKLAAML